MAIKTVSKAGIQRSNDSGSYKRESNAFAHEFKMLNINKPGQTFKLRILPPNNDEKLFRGEFTAFAHALPVHYGMGENGREMCLCPSRVAPRFRVKCGGCEDFKNGVTSKRSKLTFYYYFNAVLLSKHPDIENKNKDGSFIVYTVRVPKAQVFDVIASYCINPDRAIDDPFSLEHGCALSIAVTSKKVKDETFPQYGVQFNEASIGTLVGKVKEEDIKDLRLLTRYIPTNAAMRCISDGMPIAEAMDEFGKIDTTTGEQVGGTKEVPAAENKAKDQAIMDDLSEDLEIGEEELPKAPAKAKKATDPVEDDDLLLDEAPADDEDLNF